MAQTGAEKEKEGGGTSVIDSERVTGGGRACLAFALSRYVRA